MATAGVKGDTGAQGIQRSKRDYRMLRVFFRIGVKGDENGN